MCTRNYHNFKPRGLAGWCCLCFSHIPQLIAIALILANSLPYRFIFFPLLAKACESGDASWVYYYYCVMGILVCEFLVFYNFFLATFTNPGHVPKDPWERPPIFRGKQYSDNPFEVHTLARGGKLRYCAKCEIYKPDYAHHCHYCNKCVFRVDHHCPWINNCVGRENTKYFLLFLLYIPVGALHITSTTLYSILYHTGKHLDLKNYGGDTNSHTFIGIMIILSLTGTLGVAFFFFGAHFLCMAFRGQTSVSTFIARQTGREANVAAMEKERQEHLTEIFGTDLRLWKMLLPFKPVRRGDYALSSYAASVGDERELV